MYVIMQSVRVEAVASATRRRGGEKMREEMRDTTEEEGRGLEKKEKEGTRVGRKTNAQDGNRWCGRMMVRSDCGGAPRAWPAGIGDGHFGVGHKLGHVV